MIKTGTERADPIGFRKKFSIIQSLTAIAVTTLIILVIELSFYPLKPAQLQEVSDGKTKGAMMVLKDGTPPKVLIYHRAFILPRYRLNETLDITGTKYATANEDWFQVCVITVENGELILHAIQNDNRFILFLTQAVFLAGAIYYGMDLIHLEAKIRKKGA